MKDIIELIRASVRPVVTLILVSAAVAVVMVELEAPPQFWSLTEMALVFWFATRPQEKKP